MSISTVDFCTPDIADEHPEVVQAVELQFTSYGGLKRFYGPAVTVKCHEDNSLVRKVIATPGQGRIIVVDGGGSLRRALLGDVQGAAAVANGWRGLVIHGAIRDVQAMAQLDLGVFALGIVPLRTDKHGEGQSGIPVHFGGVNINSGDWIYADDNGVLLADHKLI
ncbi:MAG: ribonuclease E activity regulator RraA [Halieaceae bacterium]|nr:ribonuclease E activity regulator RraA [Halieaceae bacterium]